MAMIGSVSSRVLHRSYATAATKSSTNRSNTSRVTFAETTRRTRPDGRE